MMKSVAPNYYTNVRSDIEPLLPSRAERILEIGCSEGTTLAWLKAMYPGVHTTGIDLHAAPAGSLRGRVDTFFAADLNVETPPLGRYDLILALDVLEHLVDPLPVLSRVVEHLEPGGTVIVSLPNVARLSVSLPLLLGRFDYAEEGILDRTHLRFFTRESAIALLEESGLNVTAGLATGLTRGKPRLLDRLTGGRCHRQLARQFILRGGREPANGSIQWGRASL